jgi:hypothetical protein
VAHGLDIRGEGVVKRVRADHVLGERDPRLQQHRRSALETGHQQRELDDFRAQGIIHGIVAAGPDGAGDARVVRHSTGTQQQHRAGTFSQQLLVDGAVAGRTSGRDVARVRAHHEVVLPP